MTVKRKVIEISEDLCDGCGNCIISCAEGALEIVDGKARLVADKYCDGLGACLGDCPTGALKVIEREAEEFDEEAVEHRLKEIQEASKPPQPAMACGCPSAVLQSFSPKSRPASEASGPRQQVVSALGQWPIQIRLVPPTAPFLQGADLLVAADCTPFAFPTFHQDFLEGKTLLIGCPKLDDHHAYIEKFAGIFTHANIKSVTVVVMEVPCCQGLPMIVSRGMQMAGKSIPTEQIIIGTRGEILKKQKLVA